MDGEKGKRGGRPEGAVLLPSILEPCLGKFWGSSQGSKETLMRHLQRCCFAVETCQLFGDFSVPAGRASSETIFAPLRLADPDPELTVAALAAASTDTNGFPVYIMYIHT